MRKILLVPLFVTGDLGLSYRVDRLPPGVPITQDDVCHAKRLMESTLHREYPSIRILAERDEALEIGLDDANLAFAGFLQSRTGWGVVDEYGPEVKIDKT